MQPAAMASQPPPQTKLLLYYIQRPGIIHHTASGTVMTAGPNVPLIAVDQLPAWMDVVGIPRELSREQAANLSSLGIVPKGEPYDVHFTPAALHAPEIPGSQMDPTAKAYTNQKAELVSGQSAVGHYGGKITNGGAVSAGRIINSVGDRPLIGLHQRPASPVPLGVSRENPYPMMYPRKSLTLGRRDFGEHPAERLLRASHALTLRETRTAGNRALLSVSSRSSSLTSPSLSSSCPTTTTTQKVNITSNVKESKSHAPPAREVNKTDEKGTYCRRWCRNGTCPFGEDCWYRHEMPHTAQELRRAGVKTYAIMDPQDKTSKTHDRSSGSISSINSLGGVSTWTYPSNPPSRAHSPGPGLSIIEAQGANERRAIIPSGPPTPGTKGSSSPAQDARTKARDATKSRVSRSSYTRPHDQDVRRNAARSRGGRRSGKSRGTRRLSYSPDVYERELAAATAAEEERWRREQGRGAEMRIRGRGQAGDRGKEEEEDLLEM